MKTFKLVIILLAVTGIGVPVTETRAQDVSVSVSFNTFREELSPYGTWMHNPAYGQVWICDEPDFKPYYTNGHWEYTNYGWSWDSDYDWGWAPFHYGRWEYDPYYGWMWIPGYEWASAWVSWSSYDDYYGWAPLGYGSNIHVSFGSIPYDRWNFIPRRSICEPNIARYCVPHRNNYNFRRAVVINNYYNSGGRGVGRYFCGPERRDAERYTYNRIQERRMDYGDGFRNRRSSYARNNDWNRNNRRYDHRAPDQNNNNGWGNNRRREDINRNNDAPASTSTPGNRWEQNRMNRSERRPGDMSPQNNNGTPPVIENRRPWTEARPSTQPQVNQNNNPGRNWNENRMNRRNEQQNNFPQQEQRYERSQRPQMERPAPQQRYDRQMPQQRPQMERSFPAQQTEQRRMERRGFEGGAGGDMQQRSADNRREGRFGGRRNG